MMKKYRAIIGVLVCPKNKRKMQLMRQQFERLSLPKEYLVLYIYGDGGGEAPQIIEDNVYLPCEESYEGLPEKVYEFLQFCRKSYQFDYVVKMDDDVFIRTFKDIGSYLVGDYTGSISQKRRGMRRELASRTNHMWKTRASTKRHLMYDLTLPDRRISGEFYVLSREFVDLITSTPKNQLEDIVAPIGYEDLMISKIAIAHNIAMTQVPSASLIISQLNPFFFLLFNRVADSPIAVEILRRIHKVGLRVYYLYLLPFRILWLVFVRDRKLHPLFTA